MVYNMNEQQGQAEKDGKSSPHLQANFKNGLDLVTGRLNGNKPEAFTTIIYYRRNTK